MRKLLYPLALLAMSACVSDTTSTVADDDQTDAVVAISDSVDLPSPAAQLPDVPDSLTRPSQKIDYMLSHFWDNIDFANQQVVRDTMLIEQTFADFADMLPRVSDVSVAVTAINTLYDKASVNPDAYLMMASTADKYLYTEDSPLRNRALYRYFVQRIIKGDVLSPQLRGYFAEQLSVLDKQQSPG